MKVKPEVEELIEKAKKEEKYFKNYLEYGKIIKKEAERFLGKVKVLVFGSILRKEEVARDIDILIISPQLKNPEKRSEIREKIFKKIGIFSPFEIHLITPQQYRDWYSHFIKEKIEIK
jgi:predicted nucleotidyltransferase